MKQHRDRSRMGNLRQAVLRRVVQQFHRPRGVGGRLAGWVMANRSSNRRRNAWVVSLLDVARTDRVLEIGFGPGIAIREAAAHAIDGLVCGVDHSEVMLRQARRRSAKAVRAGRVDLRLGAAEHLPGFNGLFDKALAVNSMGFWGDPAACLRSMRALLRPGGRIAVASQPRCPGATAQTSFEAGEEIASRLVEAGFSDIEIETLALKPPVVCVLASAPPS
jgi:ubiquinone/menaquinone biosynthesis C-methylase UbiE